MTAERDLDGLDAATGASRARELVDRAFSSDPALVGAIGTIVARLVELERETLTDADASWFARHRSDAERATRVVAFLPSRR